MMLKQYADCPEVIPEIVRAFDAVESKKVLGSQRALQFAGPPIFKHNARMYNCVASHCDRLDFFSECFYLLLCGCGTGYSVQQRHAGKLPAMSNQWIHGRRDFVVEDSIEGWADAAKALIDSFFIGQHGWNFVFDDIRPKGATLSAGGKAPGPEPLERALGKVENILMARFGSEDRILRPIDCYDIVCHLADAVISGGVRGSATICVFDRFDEEMLKAKTGNWFSENPQRGRSNNSVMLPRDEVTRTEFAHIMKSVKEFGEPGFVWADDPDMIVNPCVEIGMYPVDQETGRTGWQGCNLSTVNGAKIQDEYDFLGAVEAAAVIGTLQAGFTDFKYLTEESTRIFEREALIGVSVTGIMENPDVILDPEIQRRAAEVVKRVNARIADMIGINRAARTTCVKPEGTASCILGTSSGIHPHHARTYIRRVQANTLDPIYQHYKSKNPLSCEESVWSANGTDDVVAFAIQAPPKAIRKNVSAIKLLESVVSTQQNWVLPGTNSDACVRGTVTHNVSNTINVKDDEWDSVEQFIFDNREYLCGVSLLSATGDKDYAQAPFVAVYTPNQMLNHYGPAVLYAAQLLDLLPDDSGKLWVELSESLQNFNKGEHVDKRILDFAVEWFGGDIPRAIYLIKDLFNYRYYSRIKASAVKVDYSEVVEDEDNTTLQQEIACAGGKCDI